jgi:hypothetical protein
VLPTIDLAPGTDDNELALELARLLRAALGLDVSDEPRVEGPRSTLSRALRDFRSLRATVLVVAQDTGDAATVRFDHGRAIVHDGCVGLPTVTFCGDADALRRLFGVSRAVLAGRRLVPVVSFDALERTLRDLLGPSLTLFGVVAHPRTTVRFLRLVAAGFGALPR